MFCDNCRWAGVFLCRLRVLCEVDGLEILNMNLGLIKV